MNPKIRSNMNAELRRAAEAADAQRVSGYKAAREAVRAGEAQRVRLTRDEIVGARLIRDEFGWRRVVRVNAKTVTATSNLVSSWTDRVPFEKVLEVRS